MQQKPKPLAVIDGETLMDKRLSKRSFCIETLLPEGISMLGGAPPQNLRNDLPRIQRKSERSHYEILRRQNHPRVFKAEENKRILRLPTEHRRQRANGAPLPQPTPRNVRVRNQARAIRVQPEAATATEIPEEPKTDNVPDDDEDEGHGFTIRM